MLSFTQYKARFEFVNILFITNSKTCDVFSNVPWHYLITKTQYLITIFSFPDILDPVNNAVPKKLVTYALTFICQVTAIH